MSKVTNTALLIWRIAIYSRDFILGDTPLNKCANLFLFFWRLFLVIFILSKHKENCNDYHVNSSN